MTNMNNVPAATEYTTWAATTNGEFIPVTVHAGETPSEAARRAVYEYLRSIREGR